MPFQPADQPLSQGAGLPVLNRRRESRGRSLSTGHQILTAESEEFGLLVAPQAVAFADAQQIQHLNEALAARYLIGQVNDILVEQFWTTVQ